MNLAHNHPQVDFEPVGCRVHCDPGATLLEAARAAGLQLNSVCGGAGTCGQCIVRVMSGAVSELTETERARLGERQIAEGYRLACHTRVLGDVKVDVPVTSRAARQRLQLEGAGANVPLQPVVRDFTIEPARPTVQNPASDASLVRAALLEQYGCPAEMVDFATLQRLPGLLRDCGWRVRASLRETEIIDVRPPDQSPLGLAVDIGSTKIAAYLVDLETGETLAVDGITNPQIAYGEDVMSRITFAMKDETGRLTTALLNGLDDLILRMCPEPRRIVDAVVVGNTAMHHLFLGLPVSQLGLAPYNAVVSDPVDVKARDLGLSLAPGAYIHLLPNVAGFIGADHVAMVLGAGLDQMEGTFLGLDIGTNTEVVLAHNGQLFSCSTASGPAFEGAHIRHGMRAVDGAIEKVRLDGGAVRVRTINGGLPIGICGSGVLDAIDQLRRAGVLNRRGRLLANPRVREGEGGREFVLVPAEQSGTCREITISEHDISEILLAKAAIRTGIDALMREAGVAVDDLDGIVIAGAFGTHIDAAGAAGIGMLPAVSPEKIRQVGNAAGAGARMALVSAPQRERAVAVARKIRYLELMAHPGFASNFARAMFLPEL
ncbi:MAG: DUF4445 domain-containing protein [Chloroflexi bacterium]|nr:DUF4445 domain-containing protein [Chloroflexota bacterium]